MNLAGVFIPAVTPFDPVTGDVDVVAMRANLRSWLAHPVHGIVIAGSTGEAVLLSRGERRRLIEATAGVMTDDRLLIAGTGSSPRAAPSGSAGRPPKPAPTPCWCSRPPTIWAR